MVPDRRDPRLRDVLVLEHTCGPRRPKPLFEREPGELLRGLTAVPRKSGLARFPPGHRRRGQYGRHPEEPKDPSGSIRGWSVRAPFFNRRGSESGRARGGTMPRACQGERVAAALALVPAEPTQHPRRDLGHSGH